MGLEDAERVEVTSRAAWRRWLEANHTRTDGIWLVTYKKHVEDKYLAWPDIVREAICFGWIDSRTRRVDDDRTSVFVTPRKRGSIWSATNKKLVAELASEGLITPMGQALIDAAQTDGSWTFLDDIDALIEPDDLRAALDEHKRARTTWDETPPSIRKRCLYDIKVAKTAPTRTKRIARIVERCAAGERPA